MIRKSLILLVFLFSSGSYAISHLTINGESEYAVVSLPQKIVLSGDAVSTGNTLSCEIYLDVNSNNRVDVKDQLLKFYRLKDGLGWIKDESSIDDGIPGDETPLDGQLQTTLTLDDNLRAYGKQTWLIRLTDQDESIATVVLDWQVPLTESRIEGTVTLDADDQPIPNALIIVRNRDYEEEERIAISDEKGRFAVGVYPGDWVVIATKPQEESLRRSTAKTIAVNGTKKLNLQLSRYDSFIEGRLSFENDEPVENVLVALQNQKTYDIYKTRTDENGFYRIGVEPGEYVVSISQYTSNYLGSHYWPEGFFAQPSSFRLHVKSNTAEKQDVQFKSYPAFVRGQCTQDGKPLADVLVQGLAIDKKNGKQTLYQTFSGSDGSYSLGVDNTFLISVVAQKEGGYIAEIATYRNIDMQHRFSASGYDFNFERSASLMSLSGVVTEGNQPKKDVYVVAFNTDNSSPDCHLITTTDEKGAYYFDIKNPGDWQVGVYEQSFLANPRLYYHYMTPGMKYKDLDFELSKDPQQEKYHEGELQLADFHLTPHLPDPFIKKTIIDFVLPKSSYAEIDVLDMDGKEVTSLVSDELASGYQKVLWDGEDDQGNIIAKGIYLCRIKYKEMTAIQPITLLR